MCKKLLIILVPALVAILMFAGCDTASRGTNSAESAANIVTTVFPLYDWTRVVLGSNPGGIEVTYLLESGVDLHNYSPSIRDVAAISTSDLFLWVGGKSDAWVLNAMANPQNQYRRNVPIMRMLSLDETQVFPIDGIIPGETTDDCCGGATHDEHVWLSLPFAMRFVERIRDEIILLDPGNEYYYNTNTAEYIAKLEELNLQFAYMVGLAPRDTILVVDRFPFLYMMLDYDLEFFSAFDGCFAATEISMQRQAELANAVNSLGLEVIMIIDNHPVANAVSRAAGRDLNIIELQDFQSVSRYHIQQGLTYLSGMQQNLEALSIALN
ncbi:MAG: metal ABC transporter substrate-binding protein [Defluviitaleaceae bacterium]|nr:metal ABC transporter substrate-binding protein [Defluviitaleaceae bacterium]